MSEKPVVNEREAWLKKCIHEVLDERNAKRQERIKERALKQQELDEKKKDDHDESADDWFLNG